MCLFRGQYALISKDVNRKSMSGNFIRDYILLALGLRRGRGERFVIEALFLHD